MNIMDVASSIDDDGVFVWREEGQPCRGCGKRLVANSNPSNGEACVSVNHTFLCVVCDSRVQENGYEWLKE
jgi:hypothetical protein